MADGATLGKAYIQIIPSMEGTGSKISAFLNGEGVKAGNEAGEASGKSMMQSLKSTAVKLVSTLAIGATIKKAFDIGADLEQQIGGVETLFAESSAIIRKYADDAYRTAGVSANEYMKNVTSFSASLLQGLGGDTAKAAEYANTAMVDMSDNANKFGTDIGAIQNAYQGFSKQNYTMLDNLKLGYGGTKEEMQRLIKDAAAVSDSVDAESLSFDNIVQAIHVTQEQMGIMGTTNKEASTTFSGSLGAMKASWDNFLAGLMMNGKDGVDMNTYLQPLVDSIGTFVFNNLIPAVGRFVAAVFEAVPGLLEIGLNSISESISEAFGGIIDAETVKIAIESIAGAFAAFAATEAVIALPGLIDAISAAITGLSLNPVSLAIAAIAGIIVALTQLWNSNEQFRDFVTSTWNAIMSFLSNLWASISSTAINTWNGISSSISGVVNKISSVISTVFNTVKSVITNVWNGIKNTTASVWNGIKSAIETPLNKAKSIVKSVIDTIKGFFNFNISWPHIPMPHFSISPRGWGVGDLLKGKIPKLGIDWYAKAMAEPRILDGAQIFGSMNGKLLGGGEAGQEVLYGRSQLMRDISTAVQEAKSEYKDDRPIVINIYAKDQDEKKIAEEVCKILNKEIKRRTF
nr:MAG TPA: tail tape measure protein [Caudoviricetes sp.]